MKYVAGMFFALTLVGCTDSAKEFWLGNLKPVDDQPELIVPFEFTASAAPYATLTSHSAFDLNGTCSPEHNPSFTLTSAACGIQASVSCGSNNSWAYVADLSACPEGLVEILANHLDANRISRSITVSVTKDITPPVVTLGTSRQQLKKVGYLVKLLGDCDATLTDITVRFKQGSTELEKSMTCNGSGEYIDYVDISDLPTGNFDLTIEQTDAAGNTGSALQRVQKLSAACDTAAVRARTLAQGLGGGTGTTRTDPFIVCTADQLNQLRLTAATRFYILNNDIYFEHGDSNGDLIANGLDTDYRTGAGWSPLPTVYDFNGQGFEIHQLRINRPTTNGVGLFGSPQSAYLNRVRFIESDITGQDNTGTLAGNATGLIHSVYCERCEVSGRDNTGGIIGAFSQTEPELVYSLRVKDVAVSGRDYVGGIVGRIFSQLQNSSATGTVSGNSIVGGISGRSWFISTDLSSNVIVTATGNYTGGMFGLGWVKRGIARGQVISSTENVGCVQGNTSSLMYDLIAACSLVQGAGASGTYISPLRIYGLLARNYFLSTMTCTNTSGPACSTPGTAIANIASLYDKTHAAYTHYDFAGSTSDGTSDLWIEQDGALPILAIDSDDPPTPTAPSFPGAGTAADPYQITLATHLVEIDSQPQFQFSHFRLMQDIDLSTLPADAFKGLFRKLPFEGEFDGNGFSITNLRIVDSEHNDGFGLIAQLLGYGVIKNLHVVVDQINTPSTTNVGAVVGALSTRTTQVADLRVTGGPLSASGHGGGAVGAFTGEINRCSSSIAVSCAGGRCGGLAGADLSNGGTVNDSYATGSVTGSSSIGGLVGYSFRINRSYATGNVTATGGNIGGLVGEQYYNVVNNSFSTGNVTGNSDVNRVGPVIGLNNAPNNSYLDTATCTNLFGGGVCTVIGTARTQSYLIDKSNALFSTWDFTNVWQENPGALPTLKNSPGN